MFVLMSILFTIVITAFFNIDSWVHTTLGVIVGGFIKYEWDVASKHGHPPPFSP